VWAKAQRSLGKLDGPVKLAGKKPENGANVPAARKAGVERQRTIDDRDRDRGPNILAVIGQREGAIGQCPWVVTSHLQGSPGEIDTLAAVERGFGARSVCVEPKTADRGPSERRPVTRIALDRSFKQAERLWDLPCRREIHLIGAQVEIIAARSFVARSAERAVSTACNVGSITPATHKATLS